MRFARLLDQGGLGSRCEVLGGGKDLESEEDGWKVVQNKKKRCKSSNFVTVSPCAPSGSLFNGVFLTSPQSKVDRESDDLVPKSKSDPGPVSRCGSFVSPGSGSVSVANAQTDILMSEMKRDPAFALAVSSLERCLKVRERVGSSLILGRSGKPSGSENESKGLVSDSHGTVHDSFSCAVAPVEVVRRSGAVGACRDRYVSDFKGKVCVSSGAGVALCASSATASSSGVTETAHAGAVKDEGINVLLEDPEPDFSESLDEFTAAEVNVGLGGRVKSTAAHATAGERTGIFGSFHLSESEFPPLNSSRLGSLSSACARRVARSAASARVCPGSSSLAVSAAVARVHASTLHDACFNSWSDTGRSQVPTGRRCTKGGVSSLAEDLRPVSEVEAGVNFRPAGWVRGQVAGSLPGRQPGTGTRRNKGSVVTPSLHPEVPDSLSVSPGPGKRIRESMGWTKVCGTAQSGIWLLKGNARACMFPANLDHLRVGWKKQGSYKTAWVTPGQVCLCSYKYGHGAAVRPQTNKAIWDGVIGLWGRVAPFLSPWCGKKELPTGVNLNHYDGSRSCVRWHSDNESLFGPRDSPKLIVSLSLGNPVEFKVRRVSDSVTSSITLNHGDVLVMDGSAQSEYLHCTMPGLQGPRVNLTYRWVAQHTASCPLAGVVGCLLPSCVQGLPEPSSRFGYKGENNWSFSWELAFLLFILMSVLLVSIWMNIRKECRNSGQRPSCSSVHFPSRGRARWVGGRRWPLSRRSQLSRKRAFYFPWGFLWGTKLCRFYKGMTFLWVLLLSMLVAMREPTPCYRDAYSVGIPKGAYGGKSGQTLHKTTVSPLLKVFFWLVNGLFTFSGEKLYGCCILVGLGILGPVGGLFFLDNYLLSLLILVGG